MSEVSLQRGNQAGNGDAFHLLICRRLGLRSGRNGGHGQYARTTQKGRAHTINAVHRIGHFFLCFMRSDEGRFDFLK